jgi:hypothetical protein
MRKQGTTMKFIISSILLAFASMPVFAEVTIDIPSIANKTKSEVSVLLGDPSSCAQSKYGEKCQYSKGETEIVFINGKSDWITVEAIDSIPFTPSALKSIGLTESPPSFKNDFTMRWSGISGFLEVSIFKGSSNSDYAYIKVRIK